MTEVTDDAHFVLDGRSLLYQIPWARWFTYSFIVKICVDCVTTDHRVSLKFLANGCKKCGCSVLDADGDTAVLTVQTALQYANFPPTVLVGEDTDYLVFLWYHDDFRSNKSVKIRDYIFVLRKGTPTYNKLIL